MKQQGSPRKPGKRGKTRYKLSKRDTKVSVSDIMKTFEVGDNVQVVIDASHHHGFPHKSFHGISGKVVGKRGEAYEIDLKIGKQMNSIVTTAVHMKKLM